jgi:hypothetical protein
MTKVSARFHQLSKTKKRLSITPINKDKGKSVALLG